MSESGAQTLVDASAGPFDATTATVDGGGIGAEGGQTSLLLAAARIGDLGQARCAIAAGAEVNAVDTWGLAPLHCAALAGYVDMVLLLLDHGADVDSAGARAQTALHLAAAESHEAVLALLIERKANVLLATGHGSTPLELAKRRGKASPCARLVRKALLGLWTSADASALSLEAQLSQAVATRSLVEVQLGGAPTDEPEEEEPVASPGPVEEEEEAEVSERVEGSQEIEAAEAVEGVEGSPAPADPQGSPASMAPDAASGPPVAADLVQKGAEVAAAKVPVAKVPVAKAPAAKVPVPESQMLILGSEGQPEQMVKSNSKRQGSPKAKAPASLYWHSMAAALGEARDTGDAALRYAWVRQQLEPNDPFSLRGKLMGSNVLPEIDSGDPILLHGFETLRLTAEQRIAREERRGPPEVDGDVRDGLDRVMLQRTGRTKDGWAELIAQLKAEESRWDWSKVEVKKRKSEMSREGLGLLGVFAVSPDRRPKAEISKAEAEERDSQPVFQKNDIIGPISGTVRRRPRYEQLYYPGREWRLHDPFAYEIDLRAQTTELKTEPLVIDLLTGPQNRLRYIADHRADPMQLKSLLPDPAAACNPRPAAITRPKMARPRSRGRAPEPAVFSGSAAPPGGEPSEPENHVGVPTAQIVEVDVDGWPYAFAVALGDILPSEEITVDFGETRWQAQRVALARLLEVGRLGKEMVTGVGSGESLAAAVEEPLVFPQRSKMQRPGAKS